MYLVSIKRYNLTVEIQPGYYYVLECNSSDEYALDPIELVPLRAALGDHTYNSSTVKRCVLPARPLAELLSALHPAAGDEIVTVKLDEPRGAVLDSIGLVSLRHFIIFRAALRALPSAVFTAPAMDHLVVRETLEPLRLDEDSLRPATGVSVLRTLELSMDRINVLPPRVFVHLPELRRLYLWKNDLEVITLDAFVGLKNLEELDLSRNRLKTIPQALCGIFPVLRSINLFNNSLIVVPQNAFTHCSALEILKLNQGN
ncbi:Leucine-rich repeat-containing G-protein coupled receptor 4 [Eumeta japonica]|uniref:Leucine-rich repeat-containing G-protein coupled receptor 4 n=1 Tax=Eumeta variegata TaxID=151549 RepID=A0A4C2ACY1_EUMVA|nr:Leucine-rich repeat-containing G-protein coupled receptor 4 [Eumeta japonica]